MPYQMNWMDEDKTILCHTYQSPVTADEVHAAVDTNYAIQNAVNHAVYVISDLRHSKLPLMTLSALASHLESKTPPNQHVVVVLGADAFMKILIGIGKSIAPRTTRNVELLDTMEAALSVIARYKADAAPH